MIRRLSSLVNRQRFGEMHRRFKQGRDNLRAQAQKRSSFLRWYHFVAPAVGYVAWETIYDNYSSKTRCVKRLESIFKGFITINEDIAFFDYFFPEHPLAVIYPKTEDELQVILELCNKYDLSVFTSSSEALSKPPNLQEHGNYILINLKNIHQVHIDSELDVAKVDVGLKCKQLNEMLQQKGYCSMFEKEFDDKSIFQAVNYNYPLIKDSLAAKIINMDLLSGDGKVVRSGPDFEHYGALPRYNDLFIGSKGIFAIPLKVTLKLDRYLPPGEVLKLDINSRDPNYKVESLKKILNLLRMTPHVDLYLHKKGEKSVLELRNYGYLKLENVFHELINSRSVTILKQEKHKTQSKAGFTPSAMFSIPESVLNTLFLEEEFMKNLDWEYHLGILKVGGDWQTVVKFNNKTSINNGALVWAADPMSFQKMKRQNSVVELGEGLILQNLNIRQFLDPNHRFLSTRSYHNFIKKPSKVTFRSMVSSFW